MNPKFSTHERGRCTVLAPMSYTFRMKHVTASAFAFALAGLAIAPAPALAQAEQPSAELAGDGKALDTPKEPRDAETSSGAAPAPFALEVKGRVFVRAMRETRTANYGAANASELSYELSVPSARAGFKASIDERLSLVLEADFSGRASIRDGYLQSKAKRWLVRAGRFKMPLSSFTLESPWTLPKVRRGPLDDVLSEHLLLSGRREGGMGRIEGGGFWDAAVSAGVFQSIIWGANGGDAMKMRSATDVTTVVRASIEPKATEIALVYLRLVTLTGGVRAFHVGGLDVTSEVEWKRYALRVWGELRVGETWYRANLPNSDDSVLATAPPVRFGTGRLLAAFRRGGLERGAPYGELFFSSGALDPDLEVTQDHLLELTAGLNVGHWRQTRLTLEIEHGRTNRNFPVSIFRSFVQPVVLRHTTVLFQAGTAF